MNRAVEEQSQALISASIGTLHNFVGVLARITLLVMGEFLSIFILD